MSLEDVNRELEFVDTGLQTTRDHLSDADAAFVGTNEKITSIRHNLHGFVAGLLDQAVRLHHSDFVDNMHAIDEGFGKVNDLLEQAGMFDDTESVHADRGSETLIALGKSFLDITETVNSQGSVITSAMVRLTVRMPIELEVAQAIYALDGEGPLQPTLQSLGVASHLIADWKDGLGNDE